MSRYKIGVTEAGDAGLDLSWVDKLSLVDGAILITKHVTPAFMEAVLENPDKIIVHATCTGYGGSVLEPNVPTVDEEFEAVMELVERGFPKEKIVIRVDPIIPTKKGIETARDTISLFMSNGFTRFRVSLIDMYPHVRRRFADSSLPSPYAESSFYLSKEQISEVDVMLRSLWANFGWMGTLSIESCAEPGLEETVHCGCVSGTDLELLGLSTLDADCLGYQRKNCMCYSGKIELLTHKEVCPHGCLYCYWK